jgi:hypothetical protein
VAAAVLLTVRVAGSQEPSGKDGARPAATPAEAPASEQQKVVKALQQEVRALQEELARVSAEVEKVDTQLERLHVAQSSASPVPGQEASKGPSADRDMPSSCRPPYVVAEDGIKRFRTECLARPPCDPPFFVDQGGIKRFRDECIAPPALPSGDRCVPPFSLQKDGTKVFKLQCL